MASWYPVRCEWFRPNDTDAQLSGTDGLGNADRVSTRHVEGCDCISCRELAKAATRILKSRRRGGRCTRRLDTQLIDSGDAVGGALSQAPLQRKRRAPAPVPARARSKPEVCCLQRHAVPVAHVAEPICEQESDPRLVPLEAPLGGQGVYLRQPPPSQSKVRTQGMSCRAQQRLRP